MGTAEYTNVPEIVSGRRYCDGVYDLDKKKTA